MAAEMIVLTNSWTPGLGTIKEVVLPDRLDATIIDARLDALENAVTRLSVVEYLNFIAVLLVLGLLLRRAIISGDSSPGSGPETPPHTKKNSGR